MLLYRAVRVTSPLLTFVRRLATPLLKIGVSGGLLWLLLRQTDTATLGAHLANMDARWMVLALALYGVSILISAWR